MNTVSMRRLGGIVAGSVVGLVAFASPASALNIGGISIGGSTLVHVRTVVRRRWPARPGTTCSSRASLDVKSASSVNW